MRSGPFFVGTAPTHCRTGRAAAEPLTLVGPFYDGSAPDFTFTSLAENGGVATYTATSTGTDGAETCACAFTAPKEGS